MKVLTQYTIIVFSVILLNILYISCQKTQPEDTKETPVKEESNTSLLELTEAQYKYASVKLGKIETRNLSRTLKVNGMLDVPPQNLLSVSVPYGGTVKQIDLLQGMKVKKGQIIAVLENPIYIQLQQDYLDSRSKFTFMDLELKRQDELQKENVNAAKTFQQTSADYNSLKATVNGLEQKLLLININPERLFQKGISNQIKLFSSMNGYVTQVNVNRGSYVNPNDIICKIADTQHLHAELIVFEKDLLLLKKGQKVRFKFNNDDKERTATVYLLGKEINADRTIRIHCHLDKEDTDLLPGMYIEATIEIAFREGLALASNAIVLSQGKSYIFILKEKPNPNQKLYHFTKVQITPGITDKDYTEVGLPDGFNKDASVVTDGAYDLMAKEINVEEE